MNSNRLFALYWSAVLLVITFIIFESPVKPRDYKNFIFLFSALGSFILFGIKGVSPKLLLYGLPLAILGVFNQHHFLAQNPTYQLLFMLAGFGVLSQFYSKWNNEVECIIYRAIGLCCVLQASWIVLNYISIDPYQAVSGKCQKLLAGGGCPEVPVITGSLGHWMVSGSLLILSFPYIFKLPRPLLYLPLILIAVAALPSGLPPVGLFTMLAFILVQRFHKCPLFWVILVLGGGVFYLILEPTGMFYPSERILIWKAAILDFKVNPLIGNGLGYFRDFFDPFFGHSFVERHANAHNEFVSTYVSFGLVGVCLLLSIYVKVVKSYRTHKLATLSLVGGLVPMMFGFPLHTAPTCLIMIIGLASILPRRLPCDRF